MPGYDWENGKSNNAIAAEDRGLKTATALAQWLRRWRRFKGCTAADVRAELPEIEWHHTSKYFNRTLFFDPRDLLYYRLDLQERIAARKEWGRLRRFAARRGIPRILTHSDENWYPLPDRFGEGFGQANMVDLERLEKQLSQGE